MSIRNDLLEKILASIQGGATESISYIILESITTQAISTDQSNPTILDNWIVKASNNISVHGGAIRNDSGRDLPMMHGTIGIHPQVDGGGSRLLQLTSERSMDDIAYTINNQNRPVGASTTNESYATKESYLTNFLDGEYVRFICHANAGMSVAQSTTQFRNVTTTGPALLWILVEG